MDNNTDFKLILGDNMFDFDVLFTNFKNENLNSDLEKHEIETSSQSILIVEDDEITREMLKKSLETNEFKVSVA